MLVLQALSPTQFEKVKSEWQKVPAPAPAAPTAQANLSHSTATDVPPTRSTAAAEGCLADGHFCTTTGASCCSGRCELSGEVFHRCAPPPPPSAYDLVVAGFDEEPWASRAITTFEDGGALFGALAGAFKSHRDDETFDRKQRDCNMAGRAKGCYCMGYYWYGKVLVDWINGEVHRMGLSDGNLAADQTIHNADGCPMKASAYIQHHKVPSHTELEDAADDALVAQYTNGQFASCLEVARRGHCSESMAQTWCHGSCSAHTPSS